MLGINFTLVHKKINLGEDLLSWEHERFSLRRLPAGTISHFSNHVDKGRRTIFDTRFNILFFIFVHMIFLTIIAYGKNIVS